MTDRHRQLPLQSTILPISNCNKDYRTVLYPPGSWKNEAPPSFSLNVNAYWVPYRSFILPPPPLQCHPSIFPIPNPPPPQRGPKHKEMASSPPRKWSTQIIRKWLEVIHKTPDSDTHTHTHTHTSRVLVSLPLPPPPPQRHFNVSPAILLLWRWQHFILTSCSSSHDSRTV